MDISRSTVQEICENARRKIAACLVHGKPLHITGGNYRICGGQEAAHCGRCCRMQKANMLIPAVCLAVFGLLGFRSMTAQVVLLLECCPSAAITSVFAVQFGHDESFAAGSVVLTTLLSIVALPLCALVVTLL